MAHYKRGYGRAKTRGRKRHLLKWWNGQPNFGDANWLGAWPRYWDVLNHTRPKRRANARLIVALRQGADPDDIAWPLGSRRPHRYFW